MNAHAERVQALFDRFETLVAPGPAELSRRFTGAKHERRVVFGCAVHGNEIGSLPGAMKVLEELQSGELSFGGVLDIFVGNPDAALRNVRMVEADLNRVFTDAMPDSLERRRAIALEPILSGCDLFIDLHQTGMPSATPFWTLPWLPTEAKWVRALGGHGPIPWITRKAGTSFAAGTCCTDEFVRDEGRPGLTLELGTHGFCDQAATLAADTIRRALAIVDAMAQDGDGALDRAAEQHGDIPLWVLTHAEPCLPDGPRLRPEVFNFMPVTAGENLARSGDPEATVPQDGVVMFPKYPPPNQPLPQSLFRLAEPMLADPAVVWGVPEV